MNDNISDQRSAISDATSELSTPSRNRRDWCFGLAILAAACGFSGWLAYPNNVLRPPNAGLVVDEKELDFGEVWEDAAFPWSISVHNGGKTTATINGFVASCGCVRGTPDKLSIPPGEKRDIHLELDLTSRSPGPEKELEHLSIKIWPRIADTVASHVWEIKGRVKRLVAFSPQRLDIQTAFISGEATPPQIVRLLVSKHVIRINAICPSRFATLQVLPQNDASTHRIMLDVNDNLPIGPVDFDVDVECYDQAQRKLATVRYPVKGRVVSPIEVVPEVLVFPAASVGNVLEDTVVLRSRSLRHFTVERIDTSHDDIRAHAIETVQACYRIRLHVRGAGEHTRQVFFIARHGDDKALTKVPLNVHYLGLDGERSQ